MVLKAFSFFITIFARIRQMKKNKLLFVIPLIATCLTSCATGGDKAANFLADKGEYTTLFNRPDANIKNVLYYNQYNKVFTTSAEYSIAEKSATLSCYGRVSFEWGDFKNAEYYAKLSMNYAGSRQEIRMRFISDIVLKKCPEIHYAYKSTNNPYVYPSSVKIESNTFNMYVSMYELLMACEEVVQIAITTGLQVLCDNVDASIRFW